MKLFKHALLALAATFMLGACSSSHEEMLEADIPQHIKSGLVSLGYDINDIERKRLETERGNYRWHYVLQGDIVFNEKQMEEFITPTHSIPSHEHFWWGNAWGVTVNGHRTITVRGVTTGDHSFTTKMQNQLQLAINRYNNLNLDITFDLSFGGRDDNSDIMVVVRTGKDYYGMADSPLNGDPGHTVRISDWLDDYSPAVIRDTFMHELGHAIGLVHTDWYSEESCGTVKDFSHGGQVHIPNTPRRTYDPSSLFNACGPEVVTGEFNANDITALRELY